MNWVTLPARPISAPRGYTLVEVLVSTFVFAILGTLLVQVVAAAMGAWRTAEARRDVYERGQLVLGRVVEDLGALCTTTRGGRAADVRLVARVDDQGGSWLGFVRVTARELSSPVARAAGQRPGAAEYRTLTSTSSERLRAGEGLEEILYAARVGEDGAPTLVRGVRSPVGGGGSPWIDPRTAAGASAAPIVALPLAHGLLWFGVEFWHPLTTRTWNDPPERGGPVRAWDSAEIGGFPTLARVTVVLATDPVLGRHAALAEDLAGAARELRLVDASRIPQVDDGWLWVDGEWLTYDTVDPVTGTLGGLERGRRGTVARAHTSGARVELGYAFTTIVPLRGAQ